MEPRVCDKAIHHGWNRAPDLWATAAAESRHRAADKSWASRGALAPQIHDDLPGGPHVRQRLLQPVGGCDSPDAACGARSPIPHVRQPRPPASGGTRRGTPPRAPAGSASPPAADQRPRRDPISARDKHPLPRVSSPSRSRWVFRTPVCSPGSRTFRRLRRCNRSDGATEERYRDPVTAKVG